MNIDNLIVEWANYERNRLESGSGYPTQTILSSIIENPVRGGFGRDGLLVFSIKT